MDRTRKVELFEEIRREHVHGAQPSHFEAGVRARNHGPSDPFGQDAERLAAALRSGVLKGRVHTRKGPLSILRNVSLCLNRG